MSISAIRLRRRQGGWRDLLRAYQVLIDDQNVGLIRRGEVREIGVTPGVHTIRLKIDWCSSRELPIEIKAGEAIGFTCAAGSALRFWDPFVNTGNYIHLTRNAD